MKALIFFLATLKLDPSRAETNSNPSRQPLVEKNEFLENFDEQKKPNKKTTTDEKLPFQVDDLYSGEFSYKTQNAVDWHSENSYYFRGNCQDQTGLCSRFLNDDGQGFVDTLILADEQINYDDLPGSKNGYQVSANSQFVAYFYNYQKQWRHSGFYDVNIYNITDANKMVTLKNIRYFRFRHRDIYQVFDTLNGFENSNFQDLYVFVDANNDLFVNRVTDPKNRDYFYSTDSGILNPGRMYNGVPDWVYEEEGVASDNAIYWSPSGESMAYAQFDNTKVEIMEYMTYDSSDSIYSGMKSYTYPKAGSEQTQVEVYVLPFQDLGTSKSEAIHAIKPVDDLDLISGGKDFNTGQAKDVTFNRIDFLDDNLLIIVWSSRIQNVSVSYLYDVSDLTTNFVYGSKLENSARYPLNKHGWIQQTEAVKYKNAETNEYLYFTIESNAAGWKNLYEYKIYNDDIINYPKLWKSKKTELSNFKDQISGEPRALYSTKAFHIPSNRVWVQVAAYDARDRHIFSIPSTISADYQSKIGDPWCVTCDGWQAGGETGNPANLTIPVKFGESKGEDRSQCRYANVGLPGNSAYNGQNTVIGELAKITVTCYGPDVPFTLYTRVCDCGRRLLLNNYFTVLEDNYILEENYFEGNKLLPTRQFGFHQAKNGLEEYTWQYEIWYPPTFDPSSNKKYPVIVDIYAGPGSQAVTSAWSLDVSDHVMVTQMDAVLLRVDTRGSGNAGDKLMFEVYQIIGQLEKVDVTNFIKEFSDNLDQDPEIANNWIDHEKVAIWGWSFGGYATSHTATYHNGAEVFNCAVAVAPLTARIYYDTLWSEITMGLPSENQINYDKGEPWDSEIEAAKNLKYTLIHGTGDDNVHFQNAARMNKELIKAGVEFNSYFYADEAHSISYDPNAKKHVYKLVVRKIDECFRGML